MISRFFKSSVRVGWFITLGLILGGVAYIWSRSLAGHWPSRSATLPAPIAEAHPPVFYQEELFRSGVVSARLQTLNMPPGVRGGIVPHHTLASGLLADFFQALAEQHPAHLIIIGPNHGEVGEDKAQSSRFGWQTPFGVVEPARDIIDRLVESSTVVIREDIIGNEHSVGAVMPFIKFYLPDADVVPITLRSTLTNVEISKLATELASLVDKDTVVVASVDFSHYLSSAEAEQNDKVTYAAMEQHNYGKLLGLGNGYLDSPASIVGLLMIMGYLHMDQATLLAHTNSGRLQQNEFMQTTSYFVVAYHP